jgi:high-affinity Fe2+/Pb2+ permease
MKKYAWLLAKFPASFLKTNWAINQLVLVPGQPWPQLANSALLRAGPTFAELIIVITALVGWIRNRRSAIGWLLLACLMQVLLFSIWFEFSERHRLFITPVWLLLAAMTVARQPKRATDAFTAEEGPKP